MREGEPDRDKPVDGSRRRKPSRPVMTSSGRRQSHSPGCVVVAGGAAGRVRGVAGRCAGARGEYAARHLGGAEVARAAAAAAGPAVAGVVATAAAVVAAATAAAREAHAARAAGGALPGRARHAAFRRAGAAGRLAAAAT